MTEPRPMQRPFWEALTTLLGNSLLTACALPGFALSFLSLYPIPADSTPSPLLLACFALAGTLVWSLPHFRLWVAGGLAAGLAFTVRLTWDLFSQGALLVCQSVINLMAQRLGWVSYMAYTPAVGLDQTASIGWFLLLSLALLSLTLGWTVVRARSWWLMVLLTLPPLLPGLLADIYPDWPPFMALTVCWCTMLLTALCRWTVASHRGPLTLIALPSVAALLALLTVLLPMEGYVRPTWAISAQQAMADWFPTLAEWDSSFILGSSYMGSANRVDLAQAGPLRFTGQTVLKVTSPNYTGSLFLRGSSLAVYTGQAWEPLPKDTYRQQYLEPLAQQEQTLDDSPLLFPSLRSQQSGSPTYTITVDHIRTSGLLLYLPYHPVSQDWEEGNPRSMEDSYFLRKAGVKRYTISFSDLPDYTTHYLKPNGFEQTEEQYRYFVYRNYLDVPQESARIIRALFSDTDPVDFYTSSVYTPDRPHLSTRDNLLQLPLLIDAVPRLLAQRCVYDPDTPVTPAGEDFVGYFLTQSRQGYCMHFASAATLIFRTYGIPARYVTGFASSARQGQTVDVPDSAAHAWVEIYLDGYGWYPVDVTPGYSQNASTIQDPEASQSTPATEASQSLESAFPTPSAPLPPNSSRQPSQDVVRQPTSSSSLSWLLWSGAAVLAAVSLWLTQFLLKRHRMAQLHGPEPKRAVLDCYHYLTLLARWDAGQVNPAARALAEKARFSQRSITPAERQAMISRFQEERQRLWDKLPWFKRLFFRYWWGAPNQS